MNVFSFSLLIQFIGSKYKGVQLKSDGEFDYIWSHYISDPKNPDKRFIAKNHEIFKTDEQSNYFIYNCLFNGLQAKSIEIKNENSIILDSSCTFNNCSDTAVYVQCNYGVHRRICASQQISTDTSSALLTDSKTVDLCTESTFVGCGSTESPSYTILMATQGLNSTLENSNISKCLGGLSPNKVTGQDPTVVYFNAWNYARIHFCSISDCSSNSGFILYYNVNGECNLCNIIRNSITYKNEKTFIIGKGSNYNLSVNSNYDSENNVSLYEAFQFIENPYQISFLRTAFCEADIPLTDIPKPADPPQLIICSCAPNIYQSRFIRRMR